MPAAPAVHDLQACNGSALGLAPAAGTWGAPARQLFLQAIATLAPVVHPATRRKFPAVKAAHAGPGSGDAALWVGSAEDRFAIHMSAGCIAEEPAREVCREQWRRAGRWEDKGAPRPAQLPQQSSRAAQRHSGTAAQRHSGSPEVRPPHPPHLQVASSMA